MDQTVTFDRVIILLRENQGRKARRKVWPKSVYVQWPSFINMRIEDIAADDWLIDRSGERAWKDAQKH